jgi:hypothetical protein
MGVQETGHGFFLTSLDGDMGKYSRDRLLTDSCKTELGQ